jgi:hypothetical protein
MIASLIGSLGAASDSLEKRKAPFGTPLILLGTPLALLGTAQIPLGRAQTLLGEAQTLLGRAQTPLGTPQIPLGTPQIPLGRALPGLLSRAYLEMRHSMEIFPCLAPFAGETPLTGVGAYEVNFGAKRLSGYSRWRGNADPGSFLSFSRQNLSLFLFGLSLSLPAGKLRPLSGQTEVDKRLSWGGFRPPNAAISRPGSFWARVGLTARTFKSALARVLWRVFPRTPARSTTRPPPPSG